MGFCYIARWDSTPPYVFTVIHDDELDDGTKRGKGRELINKTVDVKRNKKVHPAVIQSAAKETDFRAMVAKADAATQKSKNEEKEKQHLAKKFVSVEGKRKRTGKTLGEDYVTTARNAAPKKLKKVTKQQKLAECVANDIDEVLEQLKDKDNCHPEENQRKLHSKVILCNEEGGSFTETRTTNSPENLLPPDTDLSEHHISSSPSTSTAIMPQVSATPYSIATSPNSAWARNPVAPVSSSPNGFINGSSGTQNRNYSSYLPPSFLEAQVLLTRSLGSGNYSQGFAPYQSYDSQTGNVHLPQNSRRRLHTSTSSNNASQSQSPAFYDDQHQLSPHGNKVYANSDELCTISSTRQNQVDVSISSNEPADTIRISKDEYQRLLNGQPSRFTNAMTVIGGGMRIEKGILKSMESSSGESETKLARMLFSHFFTEEELTTHSFTGKTSNANSKRGKPPPKPLPALDPEKTTAIIDFVVNQNPFWKEKPDPKTSTASYMKAWRNARNKGIIQPLKKDLSTFLWEQRQKKLD